MEWNGLNWNGMDWKGNGAWCTMHAAHFFLWPTPMLYGLQRIDYMILIYNLKAILIRQKSQSTES